ncbi:hypothetical protein Cal7507_0289 [Calothrix sp. PCC 7507]|nr:hypothetical protein Cal7507_0289 [Calothrix sp. PCC 7507]
MSINILTQILSKNNIKLARFCSSIFRLLPDVSSLIIAISFYILRLIVGWAMPTTLRVWLGIAYPTNDK